MVCYSRFFPGSTVCHKIMRDMYKVKMFHLFPRIENYYIRGHKLKVRGERIDRIVKGNFSQSGWSVFRTSC